MHGHNVITRFGATVRNLRFRLGISQEELAGRANLHRTYIAGVEGGSRNITLKSIDKLARALEVSIPELLAQPPGVTSTEAPATGKVVDILLVEDNIDDVTLTREAFHEAGIANQLLVVPDGAAALDFLNFEGAYAGRAQKMPEIILLDLNLPKIGGLEALRRIKDNPRTRNIPVVGLTVSQNSRDIAASRKLGAATYIVKPVGFQNFSQITPGLRFQWALLNRVSDGSEIK